MGTFYQRLTLSVQRKLAAAIAEIRKGRGPVHVRWKESRGSRVPCRRAGKRPNAARVPVSRIKKPRRRAYKYGQLDFVALSGQDKHLQDLIAGDRTNELVRLPIHYREHGQRTLSHSLQCILHRFVGVGVRCGLAQHTASDMVYLRGRFQPALTPLARV